MSKIQYTAFNPEKLTYSKTVPKTIDTKTGKQTYYMTDLKYAFEKGSGELLFEGPEQIAEYGIQKQKAMEDDKDKKEETKKKPDSYQMFVRLAVTTDDVAKKYQDMWNLVHERCKVLCHELKAAGIIKCSDYTKGFESFAFKGPIWYPKVNDVRNLDGDCGLGYPLVNFSGVKDGRPWTIKTQFADLDLRPIPWEKLIGKKVRFVPLIRVRQIFTSAKISIKFEMKSAVVKEISENIVEHPQKETVERINREDPEASSKLRETLAALKLENVKNNDRSGGVEQPKSETMPAPTDPNVNISHYV